MEKVDIFIVGGGPIGIACAIEVQKRGLSHLVAEKGCLSNSIYNYPTYMKFFSTPDLLEIGGIPFITEKEKPNRGDALEYYRRVKEYYNIRLKSYEKVLDVQGSDNDFFILTQKGQHRARKVIVAIGFFDFPRLLNVPGENLPKVVHYYRDPFAYVDQRVLVIGSGNSAAINALECYRHGAAEVSVALRGPAYHEGVKYWIKPDIENRIQAGEIKAYFNTHVVEIKPKSVVLRNETIIEIENDFVLAMTGYTPDFAFLEKIGIRIGDDPCRTPAHDLITYETNRKGIYMAGVTVGGLQTNKWFIENSRAHAVAIMEDIMKG